MLLPVAVDGLCLQVDGKWCHLQKRGSEKDQEEGEGGRRQMVQLNTLEFWCSELARKERPLGHWTDRPGAQVWAGAVSLERGTRSILADNPRYQMFCTAGHSTVLLKAPMFHIGKNSSLLQHDTPRGFNSLGTINNITFLG